MVQQVLVTCYSRVFPSQYLPIARVRSLPKMPRLRAVPLSNAQGPSPPFWLGHKAEIDPFFMKALKIPYHPAQRTELTTCSLLPRFHTRREPRRPHPCGLLLRQGTAPLPRLVGLGPWLLPNLLLLADDPQRNFWEKPRSVQRDFSGFPGIKLCCWLWGWKFISGPLAGSDGLGRGQGVLPAWPLLWIPDI